MRYFKKVLDIVIKLLILLVIISLMMGIAKIFLSLKMVFKSPDINMGFNILITNILSMFVIIELFRGIIEYFEIHRMRLTLISDATLIFILREAMINIYEKSMDPFKIISFACLIAVIVGVRTLAIIYSPSKSKEAIKDE